MAAYWFLAFTAIMFDETFPLWCAAPLGSGGLGLDTTALGWLLTAGGFMLLTFQLIVLPMLTRCFSSTSLFKGGCALAAIGYPAFPFIARLGTRTRMPALLVAIALLKSCQAAGFTAVFMLINHSVPPSQRGRAQGLSMGIAAGFRAVGPAAGATLFAWSLTNSLHVPGLDVHFVFVLCALCSIGTALFAHTSLPRRFNEATPERPRLEG